MMVWCRRWVWARASFCFLATAQALGTMRGARESAKGIAETESLNGCIRAELLNTRAFVTLFEACRDTAEWRADYNEFRPHSALGKLTPSEFAERYKINPPSELSAA